MEQWKPVRGCAGYEVSSEGRVRSLDRTDARGRRRNGKVLRPFPDRLGYLHVEIRGKSLLVHRLVLSAFRPVVERAEVRHENGQRSDNRLCNLSWGTRSDNMNDAARHGTLHFARMNGVHAERVKDLLACGAKDAELSSWLGISAQVARQIRTGQSWRHV